MLMDALVMYSDSESEDEYENHTAVATNDVAAISSHDYNATEREDLSVLSQDQDQVSSLQPLQEDPSVAYAVNDFFNLAEQTNVSVADDTHNAQLVSDSWLQLPAQNECTNSADFWNTALPVEDWSCPEKIWGVTLTSDLTECGTGHMNDVKLSSYSEVPKIKGYDAKHHRSDISPEIPVSSESSDTIRKSCFMVHHKVAPHLHSVTQNTNRIPKKVLRVLPGHSGPVNRIHWNMPEYSNLLLTASMDTTVRVWNVLSSRDSDLCARTLKVHSKAVKAARWSACGRRILSCSYDNFAKVIDVEHGKVVSSLKQGFLCHFCCPRGSLRALSRELCSFLHKDHVSCIKFSPVDHNLFVSGLTNLMLCWDVRHQLKPVRQYTYKDRFGQVQDLCFFDDGNKFLSCNDIVGRDSPDRTIMIWDFSSAAVLSNQIFHEKYTCTRLCVHPTEPKFCAQTNGDYIAEFSTLPPYRINKCKRFEGHKVSGYSVGCDISPDGRVIVSGSADSQVLFYDYRHARILHSFPSPDLGDAVLDVAWHPVLFSTVAASTWNGHVTVWQ